MNFLFCQTPEVADESKPTDGLVPKLANKKDYEVPIEEFAYDYGESFEESEDYKIREYDNMLDYLRHSNLNFNESLPPCGQGLWQTEFRPVGCCINQKVPYYPPIRISLKNEVLNQYPFLAGDYQLSKTVDQGNLYRFCQLFLCGLVCCLKVS